MPLSPDFICDKLKKYVQVMLCSGKPPKYVGTYARRLEDGTFTFGTRIPLTRNTVTETFAIWIIMQKLPENDKE